MDVIIVRKPAVESSFEELASRTLSPEESGSLEISVVDATDAEINEMESSDEFLVAPPIPLKSPQPINVPPSTLSTELDGRIAESQAAWGLKAVEALTSTFTGAGVTVAVLDTGVDKNHPAFAGANLVTANFTDEPDMDFNGHGTHCAGTICGRPVKNKDIGVAPGVERLLSAKVIPAGSDRLIKAIQWAVDEGANVVSMSLGFDFPKLIQRLKLARPQIDEQAHYSFALEAYRRNVEAFSLKIAAVQAEGANMGRDTVFVAASGNESDRGNGPGSYSISASPPANVKDVLSVGALENTSDGLVAANFSNTNVDVSAPGVNVLSAKAGSGDLVYLSGTSMACPHVAGLVALHFEHARQVGLPTSPDQMRAAIIGSAKTEPLSSGFNFLEVGRGIAVAP